LTSFLENLGYGPGRKRVLSLEDWAETSAIETDIRALLRNMLEDS
jgi:hypothetical protein